MQNELTIKLPPERTVFAFGRTIVQLPGTFTAGYYAGEDSPDGAPVKLTLASACSSEWREFSFSIIEARAIIQFLAAWIRKRGVAPHAVTD